MRGSENDFTTTVARQPLSRRSLLRYAAAVPLAAAAASVAGSAEAATDRFGARPRRRAGRLAVVQARDFYAGHNTYVENKIKELAEKNGWQLDHSYIDAYAGAGNVAQKLTAAVQSGDAPDLLIHNSLRPAELMFLEVTEDTDSVMGDILAQHGKALPTFERRTKLEGKWRAVPHFSRAGGFWVRTEAFKAIGVDAREGFTDYEKLRDACLRVSKPDQELWGWGMTANRSGDGDTTIRMPVMTWGGQITDETGQVVVLNKEPYRTYAIAALDWLKEIYMDSKYAPMLPTGVGAWTDPSNNQAYLAGKIVCSNNAGTMYANALVDKNPVAADTYLIPTPKGLGPGARTLDGAGDSMNWYIMKGAKNRSEAEQTIKFFAQPEIMRELFKISTGYVYPAYEWGWDDPVIRDNPDAQHVTDAWKTICNHPAAYTSGEWPGPATPWTASLESSNFWTDMFGEILNGKSSADALKTAHDKAVRVFKEFGAKGE